MLLLPLALSAARSAGAGGVLRHAAALRHAPARAQQPDVLAARAALSTRPSTEQTGPGPGPRTRSVGQAAARGEQSTTSGPESAPARSPDAPADPADLAANRGSDPEEVLRSASWQAQDTMASSYDRPDQSLKGAAVMQQVPHMAGRLGEKVASAAGIAAQAVSGAASAMSATVKAATGSGTGPATGSARASDPDQSPVSDDRVAFGEQVPDTNSDTARAGELDTASGTATSEMLQQKTEQGRYQEAAERLMDIEGLPRDTAGQGDGRA